MPDVAAFGRKPPSEYSVQFAALCRVAATIEARQQSAPGARHLCRFASRPPTRVKILQRSRPFACSSDLKVALRRKAPSGANIIIATYSTQFSSPVRAAYSAGCGVHAASPHAHPHTHKLFNALALRTLKRPSGLAPMLSAATADIRIHHDDGRCSTAMRAWLLPNMFSRDFVRCNGWPASNALRRE